MVNGTIKGLLYNDHDDVDGWQLHDGTLVHFQPHIGKQLGEWIGEGDEVTLEGESHANRDGYEVLFPTYIESQGWSLAFEQKEQRHKRGPDVRPPRENHEQSRVSKMDIMRELLRIRRLIEAWSE